MRATAVFASVLAFAASATAQVEGFAAMTAPVKDQQVAAGKTFNIEWQAGKYTGPVVISILGGKTPSTLVPGATIASGVDVTSGSFAWAVDCSLGKDETYGIKITSASDPDLFQYSFPFHIDDSSCGGASSSVDSYPTSAIPSATSITESTYPTSTAANVSTICSETLSQTASQSTTASITSNSGFPSVTPSSNSTIVVPTLTASSTLGTSLSTAPTATGPGATTSSTSVPTAAAGKNAAGSLALIGLAAAIFAL